MTHTGGTARVLGRTGDEQAVRADLERYRHMCLDRGASGAEVIPAGWVVVDERVRLKCLVPRCLRAGETPNCPPHGPDLALLRAAFGRYSWAVLFKFEVGPLASYAPGAGATREERRKVLSFHKRSGEMAFELERQAYKDGYHLAAGFGGGSCKDHLCGGLPCGVLDSGRCRHPHRSRPAMEGAGIDVVALIDRVGWPSYALLDDLSAVPCAVTVGLVFIC